MLLLVSIWAIALNWWAAYKGFYRLPKQERKDALFVTHLQLFTSFAIYLLVSIVLTPLIAKFLFWILRIQNPSITTLPIVMIASLQFLIMLAIFVMFLAFFSQQNPSLLRSLWKQKPPISPPAIDFGLGVITWFLSFPIATVISELSDLFLRDLLKLKGYEQAAVSFVKEAMTSPISLTLAMLSVLVLAPLIEEFLFRGVLQTYLKRRVGKKPAILLSALCFSFFHYSREQGLGNISIIIALLVLGGYLGFLYERQKSLFAPIGLHVAFNAISAFRILFDVGA